MSNLYDNLRLYPLFLKDRERQRKQGVYIDINNELNKMIADFNAINIDQLDDLNKRLFYDVVFSNLSPLENSMNNNMKLSDYYQDLNKDYYQYKVLIDEYAKLNKDALSELKPLINNIEWQLKVNRSLPKTAPESTMEMDIQGGRKKSRSRDTLRPSKSRAKSKRAKSKRSKSKRAKSKRRR